MAIDFSHITQVGFVVKNFDETVRQWENFLGRKVDRLSTTPDGEKVYLDKEEDFCCKIGIFKLDNVDIEIISPVRGKSVWQDFLDETGGGLHHIQFACDKFAEDKEYIESKVGCMLQMGPSVRGKDYHFAYFDTVNKLGCMAEILNSKEKFE